MANQRSRGWLSLVVVGMAVTVSAQTPKPTFEVASVKKQPAFIPPSMTPDSSVAFRRLNATLASLVRFGYNVRDFQLIGGPDWIRKDLFEINARSGRQLGLKLESTRGPVDVLVIDSVQQPTEN
jgi:Protein of unknown function (DUF3738)